MYGLKYTKISKVSKVGKIERFNFEHLNIEHFEQKMFKIKKQGLFQIRHSSTSNSKTKIFVLSRKLTFLSQQNQEHVLAGPKNGKTL